MRRFDPGKALRSDGSAHQHAGTELGAAKRGYGLEPLLLEHGHGAVSDAPCLTVLAQSGGAGLCSEGQNVTGRVQGQFSAIPARRNALHSIDPTT